MIRTRPLLASIIAILPFWGFTQESVISWQLASKAKPHTQNTSIATDNSQCTPPALQCSCPLIFKLDLDLAYFSPHKSIIRDVYGAGLMYKAIAQWNIFDYFFIFGSGDFVSMKGKSVGGNIPATLEVGSGTLGIGFAYAPPSYAYGVQIFGGPNVFYATAKTNYPYVKNKLSSLYVGADVLTLFYFKIVKYLYANIFGEYSYKPAQFKSYSTPPNITVRKSDVGGWSVGGGLSTAF